MPVTTENKNTKRPLRILHLEDDLDDREFVAEAIEEKGIVCEFTYVQTEVEFRAALQHFPFDLIFSDYSIPGFSGNSALAIVRKEYPEIPYIFISGTIGEMRAIESFKNGATDYVLKDHIDKIVPAMQRALSEVDERDRRERAEQRFYEMAENIRDAFWIATPDRKRFLYASPAFEVIWGRPLLEDHIQEFSDAVTPENRAAVSEAHARLISGKDYRVEYRIVRPDSTERWVEERGYPVRDRWGEIDRAVGVLVDITERKQLEARLSQSHKMEALGQLASGVAHDFNNLLSIVMGHAELLLHTGQYSKSSLECIHAAGKRGVDLTRRLLAFSRKEAMQFKEINLKATIEEIVQLLQSSIGRHIRLELNLCSDLPALHADQSMIEQVLMNLVINARDAMPQGGCIRIATQLASFGPESLAPNSEARPGEFICMSVEDSGSGIPAHIMPHIFEPFYTTKEPGKGTGLGLATVFSVVKEHNGWVSVESEFGKGTTFRIYLPSGPDTYSPAAKEKAPLLFIAE